MSGIPKVVHYCWFGKGEMSALSKRCLESWSEKLPGFEIKCWDESNAPLEIQFVKDMLEQKKWAFASDYVRLYALFTEGGIYLDTDMEVVQDFSPLLEDECFIGYEAPGRVNTGAMGAARGSEFVKACMDLMSERHARKKEYWIAPEIASSILGSFPALAIAYPEHYFYPFNPYDSNRSTSVLMLLDIKPDTYAIHHWSHSWNLDFTERLFKFLKRVMKIK